MLGGSPHFSKPNFKNSPRLALLWQKICRALEQKGAQLQRWLVKTSYANEFVIKVDFNSGKYEPKRDFMHWAFVRVDKTDEL